MDEEEQKEALEKSKEALEKSKNAVKNPNDGETPEEKTNMVEEAKKAAKEIRDATTAQKLENDRTEKLNAEAEFGGQAKISSTKEKTYTPEEQASRKRIKAVGDAGGSEWAKDYE